MESRIQRSVLYLASILTVALSTATLSAVDFPAPVDGVITLTTAGTYSAAVPSGTTKLVVKVGGTAKLTSTAKYSGEVVVKSGSTLQIDNATIFLNAPITVESGGTFNPGFATPGQWKPAFSKPISIAGNGNGNIGAFKFSGSGNCDSIVKTLVLTADATIDCSARWGISDGEGAGMLDLAGHTLTRIGSANFMFVSALMTPGTFNNTAGTLTFQYHTADFGVKDGAKGEDTVVKMTGGNISVWNTSRYIPYKVIFAGGGISAGSGGGLPPKNSINGPVEVNEGLDITTAQDKSLGFMGSLGSTLSKNLTHKGPGTLYIGGPVKGLGNLTSCADGLVVLTNAADAGTVSFQLQNGRYEVDVGRVLSRMLRVANGGATWGVLRQKRGAVHFASSDTPLVGEAAESFGAYVFESGEMHPSNSFNLAASKANSHGLFLQRGGHFVLEGNAQTDSSRKFVAGACDAEAVFVQTGGTNDTLHTRVAGDSLTRFSFGGCGATNLLFALSGSNAVFRTDGFSYACSTNKTVGVIAVNDGAKFMARRLTRPDGLPSGTDITLSVDGGVLCPLFFGGWNNVNPSDAKFLTRAPEHVIVGEKGLILDSGECKDSTGSAGSTQMPFLLKAPEGRGIASIEIPDAARAVKYYGPVPVVIVGPVGSYGASAYADYDGQTSIARIIVTSAGCNYDETTKVYLRSPNCKTTYECAYALTGQQKGGPFVKRGANALNVYATDNTYSGGTVVERGTLVMKDGCFPANTALTVMKDATFSIDGSAEIRVSRLAGQGTVSGVGISVSEAFDLDADAIFAEGATPLTFLRSVNFESGATVDISLTEAQANAYQDKGFVDVLTVDGNYMISGSPTLRVNGAPTQSWVLRNNGKKLAFGYRKGFVLVVR